MRNGEAVAKDGTHGLTLREECEATSGRSLVTGQDGTAGQRESPGHTTVGICGYDIAAGVEYRLGPS